MVKPCCLAIVALLDYSYEIPRRINSVYLNSDFEMQMMFAIISYVFFKKSGDLVMDECQEDLYVLLNMRLHHL